ncbi:MAG: hypothetical protein N4J56_006888 [Chroococcidiopsis sp. SAG 2025]|uniref:COG1470 family protein n=1 Tax=Chroococcidiopsis sp. SAG 2025 TaxID=171389 RepID=UPI002937233D|nr:hypothetical protein [Chroococcidiopsis sp. SAG 2025]MDV2997183.1 hypothetical protein [Chroococcidiopsis sp. SAG 2025]
MFATQTPLKVILNPVDAQAGFPGETLELHVIVINQGNRGAAIDIFLDRVSQTLSQWCPNTQTRLALDPQQSGEVTFQFQIPFEALPGTYDYTLVVDSPEHYAEDTPIQYPRQLQVLVKERTVTRFHDPTFTLTPTTNPDRPLQVQPGRSLQLLVTVKNRSDRVDRYYLNCFDADEDWFTIKYAPPEFQGSGLVVAADGLELNPDQQGQIIFDLHLPEDTPAGHYSPTLQLKSTNDADLVLLDLVYLEVPAVYSLGVELETILGRVSHKSGQYQLQLTNQGNLLRELKISAKSQDEDEFCRYICKPSPVQLPIGMRANINITVTPIRWWQRPLFGSGLQLPFQIELQDLQGLPVPEKLPQGILLWKSRPWWQFLLILLGCLSLVSGLGFAIWLLFFQPVSPPELTEFSTDSPTYTEGGRVRLNWKILNADRLAQLTLVITKDGVANPAQRFNLDGQLPQNLSQFCQFENRILDCRNFTTEARVAGNYNFTLQLLPQNSNTTIDKQMDVEIKSKPLPQVVSFSSKKAQYQQGERVLLSWRVRNFSQMTQLLAIGKSDNGVEIAPTSFNFNTKIPQNLRQNCPPLLNDELICNDVPVKLPATPGGYTLQLQPKSNNRQQPQLSETIKVQILAVAPKIISFTLNGKTPQKSPTVFLKEGQNITLKWQIQGDDLNVSLDPFGNVTASGSTTLKATTNLSQIVLTATNDRQQSVKQAFLVQVQPTPPTPTPSPTFAPTFPLPQPGTLDLKAPK